jgi:hypothetical protein
LVLTHNEFVQGGSDVFESLEADELLWDSGMSWFFVLIHTLGEVEARPHGTPDQVYNLPRKGSGEHEVLTFDFFGIRQVLLDLVDFGSETLVEKTIGLVHDECVQVGCLDARVRV